MIRKVGNLSLPIFFLQLCLGVFFLVLGITDLTNYNNPGFLSQVGRAFGKNETLALVMAVVEIGMGAVLALGLFISASTDLTKILGVALFILWALYMVVAFFVQDLLKPNLLTWLYRVSWNAIILISLWIVGRRFI
jgi:uncharacterized membrane protein YphA (DoxX/SURF4 family)